jgi:hypothetical protein
MENQSADAHAAPRTNAGDTRGEASPLLSTEPAQAADPRLPLVIGVTGHRDLRPEARSAIAAQVREVVLHFKVAYPNTPLILLSALAEGADRLVAEVALESGIGANLMAPLPMLRSEYERDFETADSRAEFGRLLDAASHRLELPTPPGVSAAQLRTETVARQDQYLAVGEFIARHCQVLIALWNGKPGQRGGTADVVALKLTGAAPEAPPRASAVILPRGPVYHITTPRIRDGANAAAVSRTTIFPESDEYEPGQAADFYHFRVFKPLDDYNVEVVTCAANAAATIAQSADDLMPDSALAAVEPSFALMRRHYAMADALANRYGASTNATLYRLSIIVFMAALSFDLAVHILTGERLVALKTLCLFGLPILTGVAMLIHSRAKRKDYQNRYQDYRALAEGFRVQFFWRLAGVDECVADHYLGRHRRELQWIRNACRGSLVAAKYQLGRPDDTVAKIVMERWVESQGQYFSRAAEKQERKLRRFERRIRLCFWLGLAIVLVLGVWSGLVAIARIFHPDPLAGLREPGRMLDGVLLLTITMSAVFAALTHNYVETLALTTQVRMYERMRRLYRRHAEKLRTARGAGFIHGLFELGREALVENGEWIMAHRDRPLEVPHH